MLPSNHKKLCKIAMGAWGLLGASIGCYLYGWAGLVWVLPGLIIGGIMHKIVMENLPIHCPRCGQKMKLNNYYWPGIGGGPFEVPGGNVDTNAQSAGIYYCTKCKYECDANT